MNMFDPGDAPETLRQMSVPLAKNLSAAYSAASQEGKALVELLVYPGVSASSAEALESESIKQDLKSIFPALAAGQYDELKNLLQDRGISFEDGSTRISQGFKKARFTSMTYSFGASLAPSSAHLLDPCAVSGDMRPDRAFGAVGACRHFFAVQQRILLT